MRDAPLDYADIFRIRGGRYDSAMTRFPAARRSEFERLFDAVPVEPGQNVLDVPAGGGYLARQLGDAVHVTSFEFSQGFGHGIDVVDTSTGWPEGRFDHAVCLAALHHIGDRSAFLHRLAGSVRPGGVLHIADVPEESPICDFLDGFVGRYNRTGHAGVYLPRDAAHYADLGTLVRLDEAACPWTFDDAESMLRFCTDLFGLENCPPARLARALEDVGVSSGPGYVALDWKLLYVDVAR